jgi:XRE family transcriptional regulator, fatty acid utilization regulator
MKTKVTSNNLRIIFGLKLKNFRLGQKLSLKQLSEKSGVAISYISEIEQGKKYPKPEKMFRLAEALDVEFDQLVSTQVDKSLDPLTALMDSSFIKEFPFDLFGISARTFLNLFSNSPTEATAFLQTFLEISRAYNMNVENFLFAALRTFQKLNHNYFPEIEKEADKFIRQENLANGGFNFLQLKTILQEKYGYIIDEEKIRNNPDLSGYRSIYKAGKTKSLFINDRLTESQKVFIVGRELGYEHLKLKERAKTSSWLKVESFDQLLNNFKASYFSGALMLPQKMLKPDLQKFAALNKWDSSLLLGLLRKYDATPEMFLYRMSQLLPGLFNLEKLFYLRFTTRAGSGRFKLTKELNMTDELVPYSLGLNEHYCRRWLPFNLLDRLGKKSKVGPANLPFIDIQKARFMDSGNEFLLISLARPLALDNNKHSAMTIGFMLNKQIRRTVKFCDDPKIPSVEVNETCERCPLTKSECKVRVAPATQFLKDQKFAEREKALARFMEED